MTPLAEGYIELVTDPAHIAFEVTYEVLTAAILYPVFRTIHKRWEKRIHREIDAEHGVIHRGEVSK